MRVSAFLTGVFAACSLAGCSASYNVPQAPVVAAPVQSAPAPASGRARTLSDYKQVLRRVEPQAEAFCREESPGASAGYCDIRFIFDSNPNNPPNAFQTVQKNGRPVVLMTSSLLSQMRSNDEIATVLGHEAAHHIARHLPKQQQGQVLGALLAGGLVAAAGGGYATQEAMQQAMNMGAFVGGRVYSQNYELEADWLGAFITARAGYDPERGAAVFGRPALASSGGGPVVLSTHPASPERQQLIRAAAAEIRRQQAAGLNPPRPGYAQSGRS